ncbi:cysteine sulfinic acid decarboxylase-like isoform X2 [Littorina saxatilis]|uniref:Cysteine sulfinic acid decarboxylase n=2 Tax=Littorina saxatilis TaxID=31220 RepID=A0AAN9G2L8_9CAEN
MATSRSSPFLDPEVIKYMEDFNQLVMKEALQGGTDRKAKVIDFHIPQELEKIMKLDIGSEPETTDKMLEHCKRIIKYSVKTGHPHFYNQLYSGLEPYSLTGTWLTDALNTNIHTYEVAPVFVLIEKYLMEKMSSKIGFPDGEGIFCPGGSFSNLMAVHLARFRKCGPEIANTGLWGMPKMRLYQSDEAHYSLKKAGLFLGIGMDNVIPIATDDKGRVKADALDAQIQKDKAAGYIPLIYMATSGSTVLGCFDDLNAVADVCSKHKVWMHTDAAWGGGVLLSDKYKHLMSGVDRGDSVAWNLHKMANVPVQASAFVVKETGLLQKGNGLNAEYLFQPDKPYDTSYDIGDRSVQCGRRADAVKVWMQWKALGDSGMGERVERAYENADYFTRRLRESEGFRLVLSEFQCTNICFWYIPPCLRGKEETPEWWAKVGKVAPLIKAKMMKEGTMMIGYQPLTPKKFVNFFRIIIHNPLCDFSDMDLTVSEIKRLGDALTAEDF